MMASVQHRLPSAAAILFLATAWCGAAALEAQSRQQLAVDGTFDLRLASIGEVHVLVAQDSRGGVAVFRSVNGEPFEPVRFVPWGDPLRGVNGIWATTHGFFVFEHVSRSAMPRLSRSVDGARWE